jgi:integrase
VRGEGRIFTRGGRLWVSYYAPKEGRSVEHREPALVVDRADAPPRPAKTEAEARRVLKLRLREVAVHKAGVRPFQGPAQERVPFEDLLKAVERDYEVRELHSLGSLRSHLVHVRAYFGNDKALAVTTDRLRDYIVDRQREGVAPASIQRQLEAIRRAFKLAAEANVITFTPRIPPISVKNARQGFVSRADFEALLAGLGEMRGRGSERRFVPDADLQDFTAFAFWTGMRKGEIARLAWEAFDRETWALRLHAKDAKTGHGRALALVGPLREIMERRIAARRLDCPLVFHRAGKSVVRFEYHWATAVKRARLPGVRFHDLRRSAIRNLIRAGVDPAVAMKISGHRTRAVFDRYNIVSEEDLALAMQKTADYVSTLPRERKVEPIREHGQNADNLHSDAATRVAARRGARAGTP